MSAAASQQTRRLFVEHVGDETAHAVAAGLPKVRAAMDWVGSGIKILDLGCNDGSLAAEVARRGNIVIGCDFPEFAMIAGTAHGIDAVGCDLTCALPFAARSVDSVLCLGILEFVPDGGAILQECARVLKPRGSLIASFLNAVSLPIRLLTVRGKDIECGYRDGRRFLHRYTPSTFLDIVQRSGFEVLKMRKCAFEGKARRRIYSFAEAVLPLSFATEVVVLGVKR